MPKKIIYSWVTEEGDDGKSKIRWALSKKAADPDYIARNTKERVVFLESALTSVMPSCHSRAKKKEWLEKDRVLYRKWLIERQAVADPKARIRIDMDFEGGLTELAFNWLWGNVD